VSQSTLERDAADLAEFGYRQRLDRTLGGFSAFAAGFSYLSVLTGSSQLFYLGFAAGGPAFFWTWPAVFAGQFLVALCFAELAARYPLSGGVYQWAKQVGSPHVGWMAGWVYLACSIITLASTSLALQATLPQIAPWCQFIGQSGVPADAARNAVILALILIAGTTVINSVGVRFLARINNAGVLIELVGAALLIVLLALAARRGPEVVFDGQGRGAGHALGYLGPALAASLMATFVLYGFDTAGTLAEETDDPRRRAPRAILFSLASVGGAGSLLVLMALRAAPNLREPALSTVGGGLPYVVTAVLGPTLGAAFVAVMVFAIIVCTLTVHAAAVRLVFSMARDDALPFSRALAEVPEGTRTPVLPALLVGLAAAGLLAINADHPRVIEVLASVAVVWANLAYLFVIAPQLFERLSGARIEIGGNEEFSLKPWGLAVNTIAVGWSAVVVVNIGWPRAEVYGEGWLGRAGAAPATVAMLATGLVYDRLIRRRPNRVLDEHRA
jgi:urea carboxylase system permease